MLPRLLLKVTSSAKELNHDELATKVEDCPVNIGTPRWRDSMTYTMYK